MREGRIMCKSNSKPIHVHDCDECVYLGSEDGCDLYYCDREPTLIARYGIDGDYMSGAWMQHPLILKAKSIAIGRGLTTENKLNTATGLG